MNIRMTQTLKILLGVMFGAFLIQQTADRYFGTDLLGLFGLVPARVIGQGAVWQFVTYAFLHGDVTHLVLNLLMLALLGGEIERALGGARKFLGFFTFCVVFAGVLYVLAQSLFVGGVYTPMIGASGGIFGLLAAYGLLFGDRMILLMFVFPMRARNAIWIFAGIELLSLLFSPTGGLSSLAHLAGMGAGFLYLWVGAWQKARSRLASMGVLGRNRKKKRSSRHLRVVDSEDQGSKSGPGKHTWH